MIDIIKKYRIDIILVLVLLFVAVVPRAVDLGIFLTADEKNWIGRSYEFIRAFKDWRFNDMLQTTHPGVTVLWLSGAAVTAKMLVSHIPFSFQNLVHFVTAAQLPIAVLNSLFVPLIYLFLWKLFKRRELAFASAAVIALDPFIVGYSRLVHVDALLAGLVFLGALATLLYGSYGFNRRWLVVSAVISGLAILTKAPAVFLLPWLMLVVMVFKPSIFYKWRDLKERLRDLVLWLIIVGLLFVLLWPAILWVNNPEGNVLLLKRDIGRAALTPHHMSESYTLNVWHYPLTLITRLTPVVLGLSSLFVVWLVVKSWLAWRDRRKEAESSGGLLITNYELLIPWLFVAYVFFFVVMMMLGAKKGDRYILPVFPAMDVLAVMSVYYLVEALRKKIVVARLLLCAIVVWLAVVVWQYHPYAIAYSNPLLPDNLSQELGWGEGLEQVADWLNVNAPGAVVASWYPEEMGAYTSAQVAHINAHEQSKVRFVVLYRNMWGRAADHYANNFIDEYYKKREPVFVAKVMEKDFAWVYEKKVYERVVGELAPGARAGQEIRAAKNLAGIDLLIATYSGKAKSGELVVEVKDKPDGQVIHAWRRPVNEIEDDKWLSFVLPEPLISKENTNIYVEIYAVGTLAGDAPTIRYTRDFDYRQSKMLLNNVEKRGDLAVRLRYKKGEKVITEDETKLMGL